jgi:hypothetical protein
MEYMLKTAKVLLQKGKRKGLNCRVSVSCGERRVNWEGDGSERLSFASALCRVKAFDGASSVSSISLVIAATSSFESFLNGFKLQYAE